MHFLGFGTHPWPRLAFGSLRIWDDGVTWNALQPSSAGNWDHAALAHLDGLVNAAITHHVKPMLVLGQTPVWASSDPSAQGTYGAGAAAPPRRIDDWTRYVSFLAKRYRGRIEAYQIWNEPCFANQWSGSASQLAALTKAAHDAIKAADPSALVVSPGVPLENYKALPFLRSYLPLVKDDIDVVGVHLYPAPHQPPESIGGLLSRARTALQAARITAPIWNTEDNLGSRYSGDAYEGAHAAALTARALVLAPELGVARSYWYAADDRNWGAVWFERADFRSLTPAGDAQRTVFRWLVGAQPNGCRHSADGLWNCAFLRPQTGRLFVVWTTRGTHAWSPPSEVTSASSLVGPLGRARPSLIASESPIFVSTR